MRLPKRVIVIVVPMTSAPAGQLRAAMTMIATTIVHSAVVLLNVVVLLVAARETSVAQVLSDFVEDREVPAAHRGCEVIVTTTAMVVIEATTTIVALPGRIAMTMDVVLVDLKGADRVVLHGRTAMTIMMTGIADLVDARAVHLVPRSPTIEVTVLPGREANVTTTTDTQSIVVALVVTNTLAALDLRNVMAISTVTEVRPTATVVRVR